MDNWRLADCVYRLRRLMEARMGNGGRREFIQVLRLMENFHQHQVEQAVTEALRLGAISFDAVKMCKSLDLRFQSLSQEIATRQSSHDGEFGERIDPVKDALGRSEERPPQATGYGTGSAGASIQASPVYRTC